MANLLALLGTQASSLSAHRSAAATASHNLQNANTPGYARQRQGLSAVLPAQTEGRFFVGLGVESLGVEQVRDRIVEAQLPTALGRAASSKAESEQLASLSALNPEETGALGASIGKFFAAVRTATLDPSDTGARAAVLGAAEGLAAAFRRPAQAIEASRAAIDAELSPLATEVTQRSAEIARLNVEIQGARATGTPNDLLDARQAAVDRVVELTGASVVPEGDGNVTLLWPSGGALVSGGNSSRTLAEADPANPPRDRLVSVSSTGATRSVVATPGGRLGGLLAARDGGLGQAAASLDAMAFEFGTAMNTVHAAGFGLDAANGRNLFSMGAAAAGAAAAFQVDAAVKGQPRALGFSNDPAAVPGNGDNAISLLSVQQQALATTGAAVEKSLARITAAFGSEAQRAELQSGSDMSLQERLVGLREAASGVSIDEELVNLTAAQRAFEAVTRVIQVTDEMLQTLVQLK